MKTEEPAQQPKPGCRSALGNPEPEMRLRGRSLQALWPHAAGAGTAVARAAPGSLPVGLTGLWRIVFLWPLWLPCYPARRNPWHTISVCILTYFLMRRRINVTALTTVHLIYEPPVGCS